MEEKDRNTGEAETPPGGAPEPPVDHEASDSGQISETAEDASAHTIEKGARVGVPGGARAIRPKGPIEFPLTPEEIEKYEALLGKEDALKPPERGPNHTALVVEDDPFLRQMIRDMIEPLELEVLECGDGADALKTLASRSVDVMVLDIKLPGMDGYQVLRGARQFLKLEKLPILVTTAMADAKWEVAALESGASGFLHKPFRREQILSHFKAVLRNIGVRFPY
ncbi:MAG: response regulator [Elusimicrobiota bacterium]